MNIDTEGKNEPENSKPPTTQLLTNYLITEQIGSGSFGEVFLAEHKDGGFVAIKVEDKRKAKRITREYKIYRYLHKYNYGDGIPKIYDFLQSDDYNIMVMQLLGPSLDDLFTKTSGVFKIGTVLLLGIQIIELLEKLHRFKYIHRDIKPNNFLISRDLSMEQVYLMDFGLSKKYMIGDKHIKFTDSKSLIGTIRYASRNIHMGFEPSRRDDLESVGYMLVYFLKGRLPWQGTNKKKGIKGDDYIKHVGDIKIGISLSQLCEKIPECFKDFLFYCRQLRFHEKPDYGYIKQLFRKAGEDLKIELKYEWVVKV